MILWASNSILRDIMDILDIKKPNDIYTKVTELSNSKRLMKIFVEKVTEIVQRATEVKVDKSIRLTKCWG